MTRKQCKELLPEIAHFSRDGSLWFFNDIEWIEQNEVLLGGITHSICNVIEDTHFEARKAWALGKPIEFYNLISDENYWRDCGSSGPSWIGGYLYREKLPECKFKVGDKVAIMGESTIIFVVTRVVGPQELFMENGSHSIHVDSSCNTNIEMLSKVVHEWQWIEYNLEVERYCITSSFMTEEEANQNGWFVKVEQSKKIRRIPEDKKC